MAFFRVLPDNTRRWIGNVTLVDGVATMTMDNLPVGTTRISSVYRGSDDHLTSETARNERVTRAVDPPHGRSGVGTTPAPDVPLMCAEIATVRSSEQTRAGPQRPCQLRPRAPRPAVGPVYPSAPILRGPGVLRALPPYQQTRTTHSVT